MLEKVNLNQIIVIGAIGLAINVLFFGCGKSTTIRELQADTDRSLGTIKAEQSSTGVEIDRSQIATGNALQAISRSQTEIDGSRKAVNNLNAGIGKLQSILAECERLATESKAIFERVDQSN